MAEQRQGFRFRLPRLKTSPAPRPPPPPTPTSKSRAHSQATTTTPAQTPPFLPPASAPARPPSPQAQASARTESQPSSPSSATTRSRVSSQPPSPYHEATQSRGASLPPSPSRAATKSRAASQPPSPSRRTPQSESATQLPSPPRANTQPQAGLRPLSTSGTVAETQPASHTAPQPQSLPKSASLPSSPSLIPAQAQSAAGAVTQPPLPSEKLQVATQEGVEPPPGSPHSQTSSQITFQPNGTPALPSEASGPVTASATTSTAALQTPAQTQKSNCSLVSTETKPIQESEGNPEKTKERKEIMQERRNKQKINDVTEELKQRTITDLPTAASGSKLPTKMHLEFDEEQQKKLLEKEEVISIKETIATSSHNGKQTKTVFSKLRDKNTVSESRHKPIITSGNELPRAEIRGNISKFVHKRAIQQPNHPLEESPVSVITLAGENRGASMQLGSESAKRGASIHIRRGYKVNPDESTEATTDEEGSSKRRSSKDSKTEEDQASKAYINSNVQGINNSIVFDSSITERNAGIKLVHSRNPPEPVKPRGRRDSLETHKAEYNVTRAQKLTYEPTVRRRCLRGLFMESSDSEPDNPEKPRRHGCRYICRERSKENKIDVL
ncbi:Mediator of RNA polymerase II transcription subunit like [Actinidia chinensis var. chinensis]|uniref:Mediator of RNA polymerase II transcription subunit like n=1 Tax=Actinidia chinensis var. chinensis TaxID=1590841 RepID=A0A2R6RMS3_ACTCC|nr:Mediator of RNA polymerase II transcription subunit like [Actinidia chinensis var. chinensis]